MKLRQMDRQTGAVMAAETCLSRIDLSLQNWDRMRENHGIKERFVGFSTKALNG